MTAGFTQGALPGLVLAPANFTGDPLQVTMAFTGLLQNLAQWTNRVSLLLNSLIQNGSFAPVSTILPLILSVNAAPGPGSLPTGTIEQIVGADGVSAALTIDAFAQQAKVVFRRADTTNASPSALLLGDIIGAVVAAGWQGSGGYSTVAAALELFAAENWTNAAHGTRAQVRLTQTGQLSTTVPVSFGTGPDGGTLIQGNTSGVAVAAGNVGEYNSSIVLLASEVNINTAANITSISVPAGDFDVFGEAWLDTLTGGATVASAGFRAGLNTISGTLPGVPADNTARFGIDVSPLATASTTASVVPLACRSLSSTPVTYFLVGVCTTSAGNAFGYGRLWYRRRQ